MLFFLQVLAVKYICIAIPLSDTFCLFMVYLFVIHILEFYFIAEKPTCWYNTRLPRAWRKPIRCWMRCAPEEAAKTSACEHACLARKAPYRKFRAPWNNLYMSVLLLDKDQQRNVKPFMHIACKLTPIVKWQMERNFTYHIHLILVISIDKCFYSVRVCWSADKYVHIYTLLIVWFFCSFCYISHS